MPWGRSRLLADVPKQPVIYSTGDWMLCAAIIAADGPGVYPDMASAIVATSKPGPASADEG